MTMTMLQFCQRIEPSGQKAGELIEAGARADGVEPHTFLPSQAPPDFALVEPIAFGCALIRSLYGEWGVNS